MTESAALAQRSNVKLASHSQLAYEHTAHLISDDPSPEWIVDFSAQCHTTWAPPGGDLDIYTHVNGKSGVLTLCNVNYIENSTTNIISADLLQSQGAELYISSVRKSLLIKYGDETYLAELVDNIYILQLCISERIHQEPSHQENLYASFSSYATDSPTMSPAIDTRPWNPMAPITGYDSVKGFQAEAAASSATKS